jgi:hypothetical protein
MLLTKVMNTADMPAVIHRNLTLFLAKYMAYVISKLFRIKIAFKLSPVMYQLFA